MTRSYLSMSVNADIINSKEDYYGINKRTNKQNT